jgi:hypothetical protein
LDIGDGTQFGVFEHYGSKRKRFAIVLMKNVAAYDGILRAQKQRGKAKENGKKT